MRRRRTRRTRGAANNDELPRWRHQKEARTRSEQLNLAAVRLAARRAVSQLDASTQGTDSARADYTATCWPSGGRPLRKCVPPSRDSALNRANDRR